MRRCCGDRKAQGEVSMVVVEVVSIAHGRVGGGGGC